MYDKKLLRYFNDSGETTAGNLDCHISHFESLDIQ